MLISKLEYYCVRGIPLAWFESYLQNRFQYISVNGTDSELLLIKYGVPQGSILGPLLFLLCINNLHKEITLSKIHLFADDTNFLYERPSLKDISRKINYDMSRVTHWVRANRISLNVGKTEIILFRSCRTKITKKLNSQLSGQKIKTKTQTNYLGVILDEHLNSKKQIDTVKRKLARATGLLPKLRYYVPKKVLISIYSAIFDSNMRYGCQIWGQNFNTLLKDIEKLQNKAINIKNFKTGSLNLNDLFNELKILKLKALIAFNNCLFVFDQLKENLTKAFKNYFLKKYDHHIYNTRGTKKTLLDVPLKNTSQYGTKSITSRSIFNWNDMNKKIECSLEITRANFITLLKRYFFRKKIFCFIFYVASQKFNITSLLMPLINRLSIKPVLCDSLKNTQIRTITYFSSLHLIRIYLVMVLFIYILLL